ncbi:hypothetical protein GCM10011396_45200 [Undibacterium terreum]|uniref:Uncharacterized protein n=1 Tax=Undibacterium terreum TaxID=1224302 RepID=A0A916UX86_9BURK|nr:hypothetical protein GCM10011396_45200 [Undibacterium terreum]
MQAAIDACSDARRGEDIAFVDIQYIRIHFYFGMSFGQCVDTFPVSGGGFAVQKASLGQRKRPNTQPHDSSASAVRPLKRFEQRRWGLATVVMPGRHDHQVRRVQSGKVERRVDRKARRSL